MRRIIKTAAGLLGAAAAIGVAIGATAAPASAHGATMQPNPIVIIDRL